MSCLRSLARISHKKFSKVLKVGYYNFRDTTSMVITIDGSRVKALTTPSSFLDTIIEKVGSAREDIVLSALYLGSGLLEKKLVDTIDAALSDSQKPDLKCTVILDYSRARRGSINSLTMMKPIIDKHGDRVRLLLYKMPQCSGLLNSFFPGQLGEIFGVYHCKFAMFDECILLTGANLSDEYFTSRQDRYIIIDNSKGASFHSDNTMSLGEYLRQFVSVITPYCCHIASLNSRETPASSGSGTVESELMVLHPRMSSVSTKYLGLFPRLAGPSPLGKELAALNESFSSSSGSGSGSDRVKDARQIAESRLHWSTNPVGLDSLKSESVMANALSCDNGDGLKILMVVPHEEPGTAITDERERTELFPLIQHYSCGVEEESHLLPSLISSKYMQHFKSSPSSSSSALSSSMRHFHRKFTATNWQKVVVSSPYPSFMKHFAKSLLSAAAADDTDRQGADVTIIVPHSAAHGFHNGGRAKSLIPKMHSRALTGALLSAGAAITRTSTQNAAPSDYSSSEFSNISIGEYAKDGWTFHSKGIWLFTSDAPSIIQGNNGSDKSSAAHTVADTVNTLESTANAESKSSTGFPDDSTSDLSLGSGKSCPSTSPSTKEMIVSPMNPTSSPSSTPDLVISSSPSTFTSTSTSTSTSASVLTSSSSHASAEGAFVRTATYIGSSNFGQRSWRRDFELGFVLQTTSRGLALQLKEECERLEALCKTDGGGGRGRDGGGDGDRGGRRGTSSSSGQTVSVAEFAAIHRARKRWQDLMIGFFTRLFRSYL